jgi:hypothetical protein
LLTCIIISLGNTFTLTMNLDTCLFSVKINLPMYLFSEIVD